jgi:hypothetical protein
VVVEADGIAAAADWHNVQSPETYIGYARAEGLVSPGGAVVEEPAGYTVPARLHRNEWALAGNWTLHRQDAAVNEPNGSITHCFHARDLNLILAPPAEDAQVRFRVRLDGNDPGDAHGVDVDAAGNGVVDRTRLYQLIRQPGKVQDRRFEIEFLDAGARALCFTFG